VTLYSDSSYLLNCMRRGWYKKWRENGWLNHRKGPVGRPTGISVGEAPLEATQRHQEVLWRKVKGHSKTSAERTRAATTVPRSWPWPRSRRRRRLAATQEAT
jgi:ribonuclease HI